MAFRYHMKDLGYKRTPTDWVLRVEMEQGVWEVPAQIVADDRDRNYADEKEDTIGFIAAGTLDEYELLDWASNNMNWRDVADYATRVSKEIKKEDRQDGWVNGEKSIVKDPPHA